MNGHETKPNIIVRVCDHQNMSKLSGTNLGILKYEMITKTNPNNLLISNSENAYKQNLKCYQIFSPQNTNSQIFEKIQEDKSPIISMMSKGYNVLLCSLGKTGSGKTNSFFGIDSPFNDTDISFNLITILYQKLRSNFKHGEENLFVFSLSAIEILYNEENQVEITKDLLDIANEESQNKGYISVTFKNLEELQEILHFSFLRSENWRTNFNEEKNVPEFKFLQNQSHLLLNMNIINIRTKKINSLSIIDSIGFKPNNKKDLKQLSLSNLFQFFNEVILNKDKITNFKKEYLKNNKYFSSNILSYSSLKSKNLNFVNLFAKIFFNSQTIFFVQANNKTDTYQDSHFLFDKLAELSNISYGIEKKQILNYSQFLNFSSFIKTTELYINNFQDKKEEFEDENEKEYEIPDNEIKENKIDKENSSNISEKLNFELKNIYKKIENLNSRVNFSEIAEESEENEKSFPNSAKNHSDNSTPEHFKEEKYSNRKIKEEKDEKEEKEEKQSSEKKKIKYENSAVQENIYEIYDRKVKNIMTTLLNFEIPNAPNKGDVYIIKRNYELLLNLFQEGEDIRKNLMLQFVELKDNLLELNTEFDLKINDEKLKNFDLQKKIRMLINESESKKLIECYEAEIQKLTEDKLSYLKENERILREIDEIEGAEDKNFSFSSKNNILSKNNRNLLLKLQEKDKEISEYKKKERNFLSGQKVLTQLNNKNSQILKSLTQKENQEKRVVDICCQLEKENLELKTKLNEIQINFKNLSEEYFKNKEQLFLFKEMARAPENYFPNQIKKGKLMEQSPNKNPNEKANITNVWKSSKENKEKLFNSLKSLID